MIHRPHLAVITVIREIKLVYMSREAEDARLWRTKDSNSVSRASTLNILQKYTHMHAHTEAHTHTRRHTRTHSLTYEILQSCCTKLLPFSSVPSLGSLIQLATLLFFGGLLSVIDEFLPSGKTRWSAPINMAFDK